MQTFSIIASISRGENHNFVMHEKVILRSTSMLHDAWTRDTPIIKNWGCGHSQEHDKFFFFPIFSYPYLYCNQKIFRLENDRDQEVVLYWSHSHKP